MMTGLSVQEIGDGVSTDYTTTPVTVEAGSGPATDDGSFEPGDWGWGTDFTTTIITVDATSYDTSTTEYTVYEGVDTTITLAPNIATYTLVPTATHYETSVVVEERTVFETLTSVYTATLKASTITTIAQPPQTVTITEEPDESTSTSTDETTSTSSSSETLPTTPPPWLTLSSATTTTTTTTRRTRTETDEEETAQPTRAVPAQSACLPGDENEKAPGLFDPTEEQRTTLWVMAIYLIGTTIAWNLWGLRALLYGFKSFTVLIHESGHVLGIVLSGQPLYRFTIDPNAGGATHTVPGRLLTPLGLYLGQIFSILFGGVMVFTGFNTWASKYASFGIMALWLPVIALQATLLARLVCAATLGLLARSSSPLADQGSAVLTLPLCRFIEHAVGLRYYILFLGILSSFYILWDTIQAERVLRGYAGIEYGCPGHGQLIHYERLLAVWFGIWLLLSFLVLVGLILGALAYWRESPHAMYCQAQSFAAT
ncbi:hypothetical protein JCM11251_002576 [Rhodosporidiobolus azoricus]